MDLELDIKGTLNVDADFDPGEAPVFASRPENSSSGSPPEVCWVNWSVKLKDGDREIEIPKNILPIEKQLEIEAAYDDRFYERACDEASSEDEYMGEVING